MVLMRLTDNTINLVCGSSQMTKLTIKGREGGKSKHSFLAKGNFDLQNAIRYANEVS